MKKEEFIQTIENNINNFEYINNKVDEYYLNINIDITLKIISSEFSDEHYTEYPYIMNNGNSKFCNFEFYYRDNLIYTKYAMYVDNLLKPYYLPIPAKLNKNKEPIITSLIEEQNGKVKYYFFNLKDILWYKMFSHATNDQYDASIKHLRRDDTVIIENKDLIK